MLVNFAVPGITFDLENEAGNKVEIPALPIVPLSVEVSRWAHARWTPSNTTSSVDFNTATGSNASGLIIDRWAKVGNGMTLSGGRVLIVCAEKVDPAIALVNNSVSISVNSVTLGKFFIDGTDGICGSMMLALPGLREDGRFTLTGANDLTAVLDSVDSNLRLYVLVGAFD